MTRESFLEKGRDALTARGANEDDAVGGGGRNGSDERDYFTPLWRTQGAKSFAGGFMQAVSSAGGGGTNGGTPGLKVVENDGFVPLRKARSEATQELQTRFSFNSKAAQENYADAWDKRNPWRLLKKNVSFVAPKKGRREGQLSAAWGAASTRARDAAAVVVVDPFSSGALLAKRVIAEGYRCIRVFSVTDSPIAKLIQEGTTLEYDASFQLNDKVPDQEAAIFDLIAGLKALKWKIAAVMAGAETGVELADVLSNRLGVASNGEDLSVCRRNKYLMGEQPIYLDCEDIQRPKNSGVVVFLVRSRGVRAVRQMIVRCWDDCEAFLLDWKPDDLKIVIKPLESAGSDSVYLCHSTEEVKEAFSIIDGQVNGLGGVNEGALLQEYLDGTEYVVDTVSRDGEHRVCAIWEYDKRFVNGANFVYFGMKLKSARGAPEKAIVDYALKVLDAIGVSYGPGHMEVKYTKTGPCLIEVGTRCHGGEGTWQAIAEECLGYNQIDMAFNAYLNPKAWRRMPPRPMKLKKSGREVFFVARQSGMLRAMPGLEEIKTFKSFRRQEIASKPRDFVYKTVDCFTRPGSVQLVHNQEAVVQQEYERVRELEKRGLFDFELVCPTPLPTPAVVVVDPFSSGSILAARVLRYKLRLVMVFSEMNSPIANLVQQGTSLKPDITIQHDDSTEDPELAIHQTMESLMELPHPVIAIMPGAETGVELADLLASRFGTRNNGEDLTAARRNKFLMGEQIRSCGVRAPRQTIARSVDDVEAFLDDWNPPSPWKAVVKPLESAGSDDVFLVESRQQAQDCFDVINGKVNGLGGVNEGALVQEYLDGTEYVVDTVSRDGVHRVCAIWEYDKRSVNGANFVYFGMELRSAAGKVERELVAYARKVLDAMGIENGPGHMEVKYTSRGPCLVEVGSRCHGGEGTWQPIAQECLGYNQIDATLDCYVKPDTFDNIPMEPTGFTKRGKEVFLVSQHEGRIARVPGVDIIRALPSFRTLEMSAQPGGYLSKTVDCFTRPGAVQLVNEDNDQLTADYLKIRKLEESGLFELEHGRQQEKQLKKKQQHVVLADATARSDDTNEMGNSTTTTTTTTGTDHVNVCGIFADDLPPEISCYSAGNRSATVAAATGQPRDRPHSSYNTVLV